MLYLLATALWLVVTVVNWINENRGVTAIIGTLGLLIQVGMWGFGIGLWGFAGLGVLIVIGMLAVPDVFLGGKL